MTARSAVIGRNQSGQSVRSLKLCDKSIIFGTGSHSINLWHTINFQAKVKIQQQYVTRASRSPQASIKVNSLIAYDNRADRLDMVEFLVPKIKVMGPMAGQEKLWQNN